MKSFKNDTNGHGYCGPTAVAIITGKKLSVVLDAFREARGRPTSKQAKARRKWDTWFRLDQIKGTSTGSVKTALASFGYQMRTVILPEIETDPKPLSLAQQVLFSPRRGKRPGLNTPTLATFLRKRTPDQRKATMLLNVSNHWVVVEGRRLADTFTKGVPVTIGKAPHRRKRVRAAYIVEHDACPTAAAKGIAAAVPSVWR